jgi:diketogulonate reductase-like aldo/keto reductase
MRWFTTPTGNLPVLGLGTWRMGESARTRTAEISAVHFALGLGYRLIDTAEMYGEGGAEQIVGAATSAAIAAGTVRREDLFIVSKVYPHNASRRGAIAACERSLQRLKLDYLDAYLLHWRGQHPLADTVAAFEELRNRGLIRDWGVSNFDVADMQELWRNPGRHCALNQVYYSASARGIEFDLLPWHRQHHIATMAYSPIDEGALARDPTFAAVGRRHGVSAARAALAWVLRHPDVIAIPKAVGEEHLRDNFAAVDLVLTAEDLAEIDARFPVPRRKQSLGMR